MQELQKPKTTRVDGKGKGNRRWIHGLKVLLVINNRDEVGAFALALAGPADKIFNLLLAELDGASIILVGLGFRDKQGEPSDLKLCRHKTWSERMSIERLFSQLTRYVEAKKCHHRTEGGLQAFWSYFVIILNVVAALRDLILADCIL